jgi:hypothetical protein
MLLILMGDVQQKAVRTVISSASLMTLLTSDHLKCHCSAVAISIQYNKADYHLWGLHKALHHVLNQQRIFSSFDVARLRPYIY